MIWKFCLWIVDEDDVDIDFEMLGNALDNLDFDVERIEMGYVGFLWYDINDKFD